MVPIITWTLWRKRWFIFWWALGLAVFMALIIGVYPSFRSEAATLNDSFNQIPGTVKSLIADTDNFLSPVGYLSSNAYYLMLPIVFSVLGIGLGSSLLARDEQDHTLELILSRPVSRGVVLTGRAIAGVIIVAFIALITGLTVMVLSALVDMNIAILQLLLATCLAALLPLVFGAVAFVLTAFGKAARVASIGLASLLLIVSYLFTSLSGTVHWLRWPAKLLPYNYYHPSEILNGQNPWREAAGMLVAVLVLGIIAHLGFRRRDIS